MARSLSLSAKRFSLADVGDGWADCYIDYRPLVPRDLLAIQEMNPDAMDGKGKTEYMLKLISDHVVRGKVLTDDAGVVDLEKDDISSLPTNVVIELFTTLNGGANDPKDTPTAPQPSAVPTNEPNS